MADIQFKPYDNNDLIHQSGQIIRFLGLSYPFFSGMIGTLCMDILFLPYLKKLSPERDKFFVTSQLFNLFSQDNSSDNHKSNILDFFGMSFLTTLLGMAVCYQLGNANLALTFLDIWLTSFVVYLTGDVLTSLAEKNPNPLSMMQFFLSR
jgi:hypothetical protein